MSNIYTEIARLKLNTEQKSALIYYLTENGEAEAKAEKAFTACNNDEEKHAYLNLVLASFHKNPELSEKSRSTEIESVNLVTDDKISESHLEFVEKLKLDTSEEPVFGKYDPKDADLKRFAKKLHLDQTDYARLTDKDIEKFYEFVGPDVAWPPTIDKSEHCLIFDCFAHPEERQDEEYVKNLIAYQRFTEAGQFDPSKGLIIDGKIVRYGPKLWGKEYEKMLSKNPGALYASIIEEVHMQIRKKANPNVIGIMSNIELDTSINCKYRLLLDTGSTYTVIPQLVQKRMGTPAGWSVMPTLATGYASNTRMFKISEPWEVSLGDGVNWTDWMVIEELYLWQKGLPPNVVDCGLVGFDILNNTYQIKVPGKPYAFVTDNNITNQLQQTHNSINGSDGSG
ncbi:3584_t:CDS:2 [Ambispora leptoticha]|uniref:3584_t:CDS:1 n=1 Tax=Ambispora leptoticha TaxID=144679 RepID=A0A9N9CIS3_9GLOM|nr:3584_t:CDS:2 [Ambispora leptoticha]